MIPVNWSELTELHDPLHHVHDCAYSACLDCLIFGGKVSYPLGIYTATEREALERSDDRPDEEGASSSDLDLAIKRRYDLTWHVPTEATVEEALSVPDRMFSVGGSLANFPDGYKLRRWDPTYIGGHRIAWATSEHLWLDPLGPWRYAGDLVSIHDVLTFSKGRAVNDLRYVTRDQYGTQGGGIDMPGLSLTLPPVAVSGTLVIPAACDSIRVADGSHYKVPLKVVRPASACALAAPSGSESGWVCDLDGDTLHFIRGTSGALFSPNAAPTATKLGPGLYSVD